MLPLMNGIVLDVIVVVLLLSIIALGAFKGIKHTFINFALLIVSLAVSFMSFTNVLKVTIIELLSPLIELNAAVASEHKLAIYMSYTLLASLILTLLLYVILRLVKVLICFLVKKKKAKNNILVSPVKGASRLAGAMFGLIFNGLIVVILLSLFSTPFVGGDKTTDISYVSKYVVTLPDEVLDLVSDDELLKEKILVKLLKGDVLYNVTDEDAKDFESISLSVSNKDIIPSDLESPQEDVNKLGHMISFVVNHMLDDKGMEIDGYQFAVEMARDLANKSVSSFNALRDNGPLINAEGTLAIVKKLEALGLDETAKIFEDAFEQR